MLPESNQSDAAVDDKWTSSSETIPADDQPVSNDSDFSEDEFLDVQDDLYVSAPTFEEALLDCRRAMAVFFNNDFQEAQRICDKWKHVSPIHAMCGCAVQAYFTFFTLEKDAIERLRTRLKDTEQLLANVRKQQTMAKYFFKTNYQLEFTEEQLYYEFLQSMLLLVKFFLTLFGDPSLLSIIKCAFNLKTANSILRNCEEMIKQKRNNWENEIIKNELIRGYSYANGGLNIVFSHLPSKVLSILTMIGFEGDRKKGIQHLQGAFDDKTSLFWLFAGIAILGYNLYLEHILGLGLFLDTTWSWRCIREIFLRYPNSLVTQQFIARAYLVTGDPIRARDNFLKVTTSMNCRALTNLCNWDLIWCHALAGDFLKAADVALCMKTTCNWSPATNQYQAAAFIYTHALKTADKKLIDKSFELMKEVSQLRNRFAGKTIPHEKFALVKSEEFLQKRYLAAPVGELMYVWNILGFAGQDQYLALIENDLDKQIIIKRASKDQEELDELCLLLLLKAYALRNRFDYKGAIDCLRQIFKHEHKIQNYTYLAPNAMCDLGVCYFLNDELDEAKKYLHSARADYTGYLAETMVHFKIHNTLMCIKSKELKITKLDQPDYSENSEPVVAVENEIEVIKEEIERKKVSLPYIKPEPVRAREDSERSASKLATIQEENLKNLQVEPKPAYEKKSYSLDYSTRSRSETSLASFNDIEFNTNAIGKNRNLNEINSQLSCQSNPQMHNNRLGKKSRKIDNERNLKELVNDLGSFKERLIAKQRKNSILKRVKSLSKINFTKNLQTEMLRDEIEFDLQKNEKANKKRMLFKRRISGIF